MSSQFGPQDWCRRVKQDIHSPRGNRAPFYIGCAHDAFPLLNDIFLQKVAYISCVESSALGCFSHNKGLVTLLYD